MAISRADKEFLKKSKKAEIQQLKHRKDLLLDQKQSSKKIEIVDAEILKAQKELKAIQELVENDEGTKSNITIHAGNGTQIITGSGDVTQNNFGLNSTLNSIDFEQLEKELSSLYLEMKKLTKTDEHDIAIGEIVKAKKAAKEKDKDKIYESLKSAGKWALDIATKIGTPLAVEIIKTAIGL